ncbi:MAG: hypothetical protein U7127_09670 [Phormidium sp.]
MIGLFPEPYDDELYQIRVSYPRYDGEKIHGWRSHSVQGDRTIEIGF